MAKKTEAQEIHALYNQLAELLDKKTPIVALNALMQISCTITISYHGNVDDFITGARETYEAIDKEFGDEFRRNGAAVGVMRD